MNQTKILSYTKKDDHIKMVVLFVYIIITRVYR